MSCRFPGCDDYRGFWRLLAAGENHIVPVPEDRWATAASYSPDPNAPNRGVGKWGGFLTGIDRFDHRFFGISPREARSIDPQQRLLLEQVWRCIEDSGIALSRLQEGATAVYVGGMAVEYEHELRTADVETDAYACSGNFRCMLANRVSHAFDFKGPSVSIDTACSSSLVALHEARVALQNGLCDFALVAGVSLNLSPWKYTSFSKARMLSPDGQCKTFDQNANGYVPGEGVAALLLQRLPDAVASRSHCHGLLKGSAVNHGGHALSLTAPRVEAQRAVIVEAWRSAGISPETCTYLEAHGTGTSLGDPIEVEALTQAFREFTSEKQFCAIGSVKTNIGHLEPAAGLAGVIKVLLMMGEQRIPPSLNVRVLNPLINFAQSPFHVATRTAPWSVPAGVPRRAGVSSFGFGGANAHVVLEAGAAPRADVLPAVSPTLPEPQLFVLSAKSPESHQQLLATWLTLARSPEFATRPLADAARTLQTGRESFPYRFAAVASNAHALAAALETRLAETAVAVEPRPLCLFIGEPAAQPALPSSGTAWDLFPPFAEAWRACAEVARLLGHRIDAAAPAPLDSPAGQLRAFALQYANGRQVLAASPSVAGVAGSGIGFWAALALSGMLRMPDAMARMLQPAAPGSIPFQRPNLTFLDVVSGREILPLALSESYLESILRQVTNAPDEWEALLPHARQLVACQFTFKKNLESWNGPLERWGQDIDRILRQPPEPGPWRTLATLIIGDSLRKLNRKWRLSATLAVSSAQENEFLDLLDDGVIEPAELVALICDPDRSFAAFTAKAILRSSLLDPRKPYLLLRQLNQSLAELGDAGVWLREASTPPLQVSLPPRLLPWLLGTCPPGANRSHAGIPPIETRGGLDRAEFLQGVKQAWVHGAAIKWDALPGAGPFTRAALPTYPFVGERHWIPRPANPSPAAPPPPPAATNPRVCVFDPASHAVVRDHVIGGRVLLPAACTLDLALQLPLPDPTDRTLGRELRDLVIHRPTVVSGPQAVEAFRLETGAIQVTAGEDRIATGRSSAFSENLPAFDPAPWTASPAGDASRIYPEFAAAGYAYGPALQVIARFWASPTALKFELASAGDPAASPEDSDAALIDGALQAALVASWHFSIVPRGLWLPCQIEVAHLVRPVRGGGIVVVRRDDLSREAAVLHASLAVYSPTGEACLELRGVRFIAAAAPSHAPAAAAPAPAISSPAPAAASTATPHLALLEAELGEMLGRTLQVTGDEFDADTDLRDYGLDSLALTEYAEAVEARLQVVMEPTQLFSHPTLRGLAQYLARTFPGEISRHYPAATPGNNPPAQPAAPELPPPAPTPPSVAPAAPVVAPGPAQSAASAGGTAAPDPIAIVGMAGRFPQSADLAEFWRNLATGSDLVTEVPQDRWDWQAYFGDPHSGPNKTSSKWGGFLKEIDKFDAGFFRISPKEAAMMDPQQRIMLELAWQAIEDSGHAPSALRGSATGVFIGVCNDDYRELIDRHAPQVEAQTSTGTYFSIIPNRLSFWFDWHGPSLAIDTACSSSLVALHQAVNALRNGECDQALAGGINICCTPRRHISFSHAGMLAPDGRCRSFDASGRGYVRGEGAGLVLLKPLSRALADGNPIHGLIRGSAVNHGGSANSLTAPNPNAQAALLVQAYRRAGIAPETVSYLEAHGTGTELGDPIEIAGLKQAFSELGQHFGSPSSPHPTCGIGSVKTNIGHLESAAGIAGVIKVLLAMRHRSLPATLHFRQLNPHIKLEGTPFEIVAESRPWTTSAGAHPHPLPRRAGVSSFGFGGVNGHVILEEWSAAASPSPAPTPVRPREIVVLSARDEEALRRVARALLAWVEAQPPAQVPLADLACTLQLGRDALECRAAFVVGSAAELVAALTHFLGAARAPDGARRAPGTAAATGLLRDEPEDRAFVQQLWAAGKLERIARLWTAGAFVPWSALAPTPPPRRLSLPTYAFARERHWIADLDRAAPAPAAITAAPTTPDPLARLIGPAEPVVRHHLVLGRAILPGVVGLELARAAALRTGSRPPTQITDVLWLRPVVVEDAPLEVRLRFAEETTGRRYELVSGPAAAETTHATGGVSCAEVPAGAALDLAAVRQRCPEVVSGAQVYQTFHDCGVGYGPYFQGLREVRYNSEEFLGRIEFPAGTLAAGEALPPPIMDSAVQITLWWLLHTRGLQSDLYLPFSVDRLTLHGPPAVPCFVHVRPLEINRDAGFARFDLTLVDARGQPWVELAGFCIRQFKSPRPGAGPDAPTATELFFRPIWRPVPPAPVTAPVGQPGRCVLFRPARDAGLGAQVAALVGRPVSSVYLGRNYDRPGPDCAAIDASRPADFARICAELPPDDEVCFLAAGVPPQSPPDPAAPAVAEETGVLALFRLVQALAAAPIGATSLRLTVFTRHAACVAPDDTELDPSAAALCALAQVTAREFSHWQVRVVDLPAAAAPLAANWPDLGAGPSGSLTAWRDGQPWQRVLQPVHFASEPATPSLLRTGGTYLIVGGARGLGLETARLLAHEAQANLVLVGRRSADAEIEATLQSLAALGGRAIYCPGDITSLPAMAAVVQTTRERFGPLHGIVHSALVLRDAPLTRLSEADFRAAWEPKAHGFDTLLTATAGETLDFILVHSSLNAFWANASQGNYVAGCAYKDARALQVARARSTAVRVINWGFWGDTGVVSGGGYHEALARQGVFPFSNAEGAAALRQILAGPLAQVVAAKVEPRVLQEIGLEPRQVSHVLAARFPSCFAAVTGAARPFTPPPPPFAVLFDRLADYGRLRLLQACRARSPQWQPGESLSRAALRALLGAEATRPAHFDALLDLLATGGFLQREGEACHLTPAVDDPALLLRLAGLAAERTEIARLLPDARPYLDLMDACLDRWPELLSGQLSGVEALFPGGASTLVDAIYRGNGVSDYYNRLLAEAVRRFITQRRRADPAAPIRILEIGAGVGGTTTAVLPGLAGDGSAEYHFTDLSASLVQGAQQRWATEYPQLRFRVLDIEQASATAPDAQRFDLVIATNVLHATRDLPATLQHVKSFLCPHGLLLLNEVTRNQPYLTLTFGWLEGWWRFGDGQARLPHSPLLSPSRWQHLLRATGFAPVAAWGDPALSDPESSAQTLFVAESDGVITLPAPAPRASTPPAPPPPAPAAAIPAPAAPAPVAPSPESNADLDRQLATVIGAAVGRQPDDIPPDARFTDLGVDSIIGIAIVSQINRTLGLRLKNTALFNYTSLSEIAAHIRTLQPAPLPVAPPPLPPAPPPALVLPAAAAPAPTVSSAPASAPALPAESPRGLVAIVGMSGRFPGAANLEEFWQNLAQGRDGITEVPVSRWGRHDAFFDPDRSTANRAYLKSGGFLSDIEYFDPLFFDISPREAERMDPQQRVFLEESWRALEDAGYSNQQLADTRCGVFVGVSKGDYFEKMHAAGVPLDAHTWIGNETSILSARIAYHLNLKGPAFPVDTACSSSLVALHLACQSILAGDCDLSLVGGVFLLTTPTFYVHTSKTMMLSPVGQCRAFDNDADGFVPGEGAAVVVLKSLERALADGDTIHGVIRGSGINQDGRTNGITAPSAISQQRLIQDVHARAGLDPATITCVEAHGTGTKLGDPIEVEALTAAFRAHTDRRQFCALGSVKTNIGHTATVAGLAGLIKVLLAFRHRQIPPSLHFRTPNADIDFGSSPFFVNTALRPWQPPAGVPRRAAVSSFGFSGTNGHVVVEEAPAVSRTTTGTGRPPHLFCLSAKTGPALRQRVRQLARWLEATVASAGAPDPADVSFTLGAGRSHFGHRLACVATDLPDLHRLLIQWEAAGASDTLFASSGSVRENPTVRDRIRREFDHWPAPDRTDPARRREKLLALARGYAEGATLDWSRCFPSERRQRLPLPTYPFDRERCWPWPEGEPVATATTTPALPPAPAPSARPLLLLQKTWTPHPFPVPGRTVPAGTWLLLTDTPPPADWQQSLTAGAGIRWVLVRDTVAAPPATAGEFSFPFNDPAAATRTAQALVAACPDVRGILHLADPTWPEAAIAQPPLGVFEFYQKLLGHFGPAHFTLLLVTQGAQAYANPAPTLAGAIPAGLVRMLGAEHAALVARTVDLDSPAFSATGLAAIQRELASADPVGEICHRQGTRYTSSLQALPELPPAAPPLRVDAAKVYLVTGGTGGLGLAAARRLVERGARKLLLLGRQPLPPRSEWDVLLAQPAPSPLQHKIRGIAELEAAGATVRTATVDLTDAAAVTDLLSSVRHKLGLFGGVLHCAGAVGDVGTPFLRKEAAAMARVLAPKVAGTQILSRALRDDPLDFFLLYSSVAGVVPALGVGAADYACANAFLDTFAAWQHARGQTCFRALCWPSWKETGIGEVRSARFLDTGLLSLHTAEGLALLEHAAHAAAHPLVVPCAVDPSRFQAARLLGPRLPPAGPAAAPAAGAPAPTPAAGAPAPAPAAGTDPVRARLVAILSEHLRIPADRLDGDANFGEFGIDSILLADFVKKIEAVTGCPLDPSLFLEFPTINLLSGHLREHHGAAFAPPAAPATPPPAALPPAPEPRLVVAPAETAPLAIVPRAGSQPIAIIGLGGRFPGADDPGQFWDLLRSGRTGVREVPVSRWDPAKWYSPVAGPGRTTGKWGGFLEGIDRFDAAYFGIADDDAVQMDPLARLFLETSVQTVRDAGYAKETLWNSRTGVFVGSRISTYSTLLPHLTRNTIVGIGQNFIAAQVAQFMHLRGPILVLDTACSSSLTALHFACQSLRAGECAQAIAGGVDLLLDEKIFLMLSEAGVLSPEGKCRTFDAGANGYVPGEGCGAVLLKPLAQALADGDRIRAVIAGSAINNDGHTMGITTPSLVAQEELIGAALRAADVSADSISYVEAHGTGTMIGDPIELKALTRAFAPQTTARQFCGIGSVKSNLGHLHSAAGIASVAKVILALQQRELPPTLHCARPNPRFAFADSPFFPVTTLQPWTPRQGVRRAGISSFGFGGTNCHLILEEAPAPIAPLRPALPPADFQRKSYWPVRAQTPSRLPPNDVDHADDDAIVPAPFLVLEEVTVA
jgi:acyl transferase domain-containing protein